MILPTIELPRSAISSLQNSVDDYFNRLKKLLENPGSIISAIVLPGGGNIRIPKWFSDWCKENGITVHVVDSDNVDRVIAALEDN